MLPKDFPPFTTVQYYFHLLPNSGLLDILNETLVAAARLMSGRDMEPTAGIIPSRRLLSNRLAGNGQSIRQND